MKRFIVSGLLLFDNTVDMYYSTDGKNRNKIENPLEISEFNHNAFGGFLGVRIGLCSISEGAIKFRNFRYNVIK
jgi:xylan 1,4-beta-xylosidase